MNCTRVLHASFSFANAFHLHCYILYRFDKIVMS